MEEGTVQYDRSANDGSDSVRSKQATMFGPTKRRHTIPQTCTMKTTCSEDLEPTQPPPGIAPQYVHLTSKAMAKPAAYKPTSPCGQTVTTNAAQLDEIETTTKELALESNENKEEKNHMESLMDTVQVQPWWQYEDDVTKYN
eukprot:6122768-Amphidinium_carterae.1